MVHSSIRSCLLSVLQKRFLQSSAAAVPPASSSFTVQFLVNSCGLSLESAVSSSKKFELHERNVQKPQDVILFLRSHGFDDTRLAKLVEKRPQVLHCRIDNNLRPKFSFFIQNGFVGQLLHDLILSNPSLLRRSLDSYIKPSVEFLRRFIDSNERIVVASKNSPWLLSHDLEATMKPNIEFLLKEGVPVRRISKLIVNCPRAVLTLQDKMVHTVKALKTLGLQPEAPAFADAIRVMLSVSEPYLRKKMEVLKSMGWTQEEILLIFKRKPHLLKYSEEKLRSGLVFYANNLNWGPQTIIAYPFLLTYSLDKRIRPRYNFLKVLESKKLIKVDKKIASLLNMSEDSFLKHFVARYANEVSDLLEQYLEETKQRR